MAAYASDSDTVSDSDLVGGDNDDLFISLPQRTDYLSQENRISSMRFVRDRELGIRGMNHRFIDIRYCDNVNQ